MIALALLLPAAVALTLFLVTLAPSVATGDSGELTTVAANLGIAHPPGYPTFTVLGHLFTLLPVGDVAFRVNLMSAVLDAVAVALMVAIVGRMVDAARAADGDGAPTAWAWVVGSISGAALAVSTAFWRYSLVAEVFALANLLALALLLLMLEWRRLPRARYLWTAAFVAGLALTNQQTIVFAAPALVILLGLGILRLASEGAAAWMSAKPLQAIGVAIAAGVAGLLPYAYLPLAAARGAPAIWGDPTTVGGFVGMVSRSVYGTFSLTVRDAAGSILEHWWLLGEYLVSAFSPIGIFLTLIGAAWLARRLPGEALALGAWFLMTGPVFVALANPPLSDPVTRGVLERFYILPSLPIAALTGVGVWALAAWAKVEQAKRAKQLQIAGPVVIAMPLLGLAVLAGVRLPDVDQSRNRVAATYAGDLLASLPPRTVLLTRSDENYTSLLYAQKVTGARPDVVAIDTELLKLASYVERLRADHPEIDIPFGRYDGGVRTHLGDLVDNIIALQPVYVVGVMEEDLSDRFDLLDEGLVDRVLPDGEAPDPLATLRRDPRLIDRLHPPGGTWPVTSWEAAIAAHYAEIPFKTGVALQQLGPQPDAAEVADLYRKAISISPTLASAYKNLGLLLQLNGGAPSEIIAAWSRYLELRPDDPEAAAIRATIKRLVDSIGS